MEFDFEDHNLDLFLVYDFKSVIEKYRRKKLRTNIKIIVLFIKYSIINLLNSKIGKKIVLENIIQSNYYRINSFGIAILK